MTLLAIVQNATDELGLPRPLNVVSNTEETVRRLFALSNREGKELAEMRDWPRLHRLHSFTTVADQEEYDLPADFYSLIGATVWNRDQTDPIFGPTSPQVWQDLKSGLIGSIVDQRYRIYRSQTGTTRSFYIDPVPTEAEDCVFEFRSNHWCSNADLTVTRAAWVADTDVGILDEDLMTLGLIYRWRRALRMSWDAEWDDYAKAIQRKVGADGGAPILSLARRPLVGLGLPSTPDTGFGA